MTTYTMPNDSSVEIDCLDIVCEVEYLPGYFTTTRLSPDFINMALAKKALESIQKTVPSARIRLNAYPIDNDKREALLSGIAKRDTQYLQHLKLV